MNTAILQAPMGALADLPSVVALSPGKELLESLALAVDEMSRPSVLAFAGGTAGVFTRRSPGKSTPNEDVAAIVPLGPRQGVLIVADGLGGHANGEVAFRKVSTEIGNQSVALAEEFTLTTAELSYLQDRKIAEPDSPRTTTNDFAIRIRT